MSSFTRTLNLDIKVDPNKLKQIQGQFDELSLKNLIPDANLIDIQNVQEEFTQVQLKLKEIEDLKKAISKVSLLDGDSAVTILDKLNERMDELLGSAGEFNDEEVSKSRGIVDVITNVFSEEGAFGRSANKAFDNITNNFRQAMRQIKTDTINLMNTMASHNLGGSIFGNQEARERALRWGINDAENFALGQVLEELRMSEEDLWWMNETQRDLFAERMAWWTNQYNEKMYSGFFEDWQEFQLAWTMFRNELQMTLISWIIDNKDTLKDIMDLLKTIMEVTLRVAEPLLNAVTGLFNLLRFERSERTSQGVTSDIINNNRVASTTNQNVSIDNTFNGVENSNRSWLVNAGEQTYRQIIEALR